ncbi:MAG TPA: hypothetical protein VIU62_02855, partial [Chloroflexota bacterium]
MAEVQLATLAAEAREAIDNQDLSRAAEACRRALLRYPRWVEGYWLLGHILVESGYVPQARSCFEAVASAMPDDPRAYQGLADAAEQQQDLTTAVAGLIRALEVGETSPSVLAELRRLQQQAGYVVDNPYTTARVAHARLIAGQFEESDVAAERALQQEPDRLDLLVVQAVARLFGGDRRGSQTVCQHLLDLSPDCLKALAILRYLQPGEESAALTSELEALDPEGQTLVWLRGHITTLGYDADDLPAAPRLVTWQEDDTTTGEKGRELRPLDRLIPELEEVWPQWLQQAAQATPEAHSDDLGGTQAAPPPPPPFADSPTSAAAAPSFLGDVDTLAREFEDAMRPAPVEPEPPSAVVPQEETAPAVAGTTAGAVLAYDWPPPPPAEEPVVTEAAAGVAGEENVRTLAAPTGTVEGQAAAAVPSEDEFAQWRTSVEDEPQSRDTPLEVPAEVEPVVAEPEPEALPAGTWEAWVPESPIDQQPAIAAVPAPETAPAPPVEELDAAGGAGAVSGAGTAAIAGCWS